MYGHTFPFLREYIYLFHISVFLMASGFCWKDNVICDFKSYKKYILKKLRSLYIPYVMCNGIFILLRNFFIRLNIYSDNKAFLILTEGAPYPQQLISKLSGVEIIKEEIKVVFGIGTTQLGSATWFLIALIIVLFIHGSISYLFRRKRQYLDLLNVSLFIIMAVISLFVNNTEVRGEIRRMPCTYMAFLLGIFVKKIIDQLSKWWMIVCAILALAIMPRFGTIEMSAAHIQNPVFFVVASIAGWILLWNISYWGIKNCNVLKKVIEYIGKKTMPILCMHLLAFKISSLLYIVVTHKSKILLASFHIIFETSEMYKLIYTLLGVLVPLMVCYMWNWLKMNINTVVKHKVSVSNN